MEMSKADDGRFLTETGAAAAVAVIVEPVLIGLGFRLVRVQISGRDGQTVQVMAERPDGFLTVDECATISRALSPTLDAYEPVSGAYRLEISSPGIDRPLVRPEDFERWAGHEAKIELRQLVDGRKRFQGAIEGYSDGEVRLFVEVQGHAEPRVLGLAVASIATAKLVMTDVLLKESLRRQAGQSRTMES